MVHGDINPEFFGQTKDLMACDNFIIDSDENVNSAALQTPVNYQDGMTLPSVWKIFSQSPLSDDTLGQMFLNRKQMEICDWLAYPSYSTNQTFTTKFKLEDNLYHVNAIEFAASAMEMSVIGAKNVANLVTRNRPGKNKQHSNVGLKFKAKA